MHRIYRSLSALLLATLVTGTSSIQAKPVVHVMTDPGRSMRGETIMFKIRITNDTDGEIDPPQMPMLTDWDLTNSFTSTSRSMRVLNGDIKYTITTELTYILRPLRAGLLKIPSLSFKIGAETHKTEGTTIQVDRVASGPIPRTRPPMMPQMNPRGPNPFASSAPPPPSPPAASSDVDVPDRETLFVRAEPSKKSVYQGELISLAYSIYERHQMGLAEPSIIKFPDFKGFLKEELDINKNYTPVPVQVNGETFLRIELIRFAVFPIRSGRLHIEPLRFRATVMPTAADLMNSMMNGTIPSADGIPMEKASQELIIDSKPLPPLPLNAPFTGGVGQFQVDVKGPPSNRLQVDQPFSITVTIAGKGNIKSIEEPHLNPPKSFESGTTRTQYEFRPDATGFKSFEYLLIPRAAGKVRIEGLEWTYFDPIKEQYQSYKGPPLDFDVDPSTATPKDEKAAVAKKLEFSEWKTDPQHFVSWKNIFTPGLLGSKAVWGAQGVLYTFLLFLFWRKKAQEKESAYYMEMPWEKTAKIILSQGEWDNQELALLIDLWARQRLTGLLHDVQHEIHTESPRDDFLTSLRDNLVPDYHDSLTPLKKYWSDLDLMRFSGSRSSQARGADFLNRAKSIFQNIIAGLEKSKAIKNPKKKR